MKVIILGAGVIGVTSAYVLASRGHEVTIIERNDGPAQETSFANGGQLSYSHAEPWANPCVPRELPGWMLKEDSPLIFRPRADWRMITWGLKFLYNCTTAPSRKSCVDMLRLGLYSREKMKDIREATNIEFDFANSGILHFFTKELDFNNAKRQADFQHHFGCEEKVLSKDEVLSLEPALEQTQRDIIGGIHAHLDESGDPYLYCQALCEYMQSNMGVEILYNTEVTNLAFAGDDVARVETNQGTYKADKYVVSLASYSPLLTRKHGVNTPIYPMKGYSITVPADEHAPNISITDATYKIVYSKLGKRIRVAGTAEFAGYNTDILQSRVSPIVKQAARLFPNMDWESERTEWACIRPSTPDGPPRIGNTKYRNLLLNTGHGTLGWTQCAGSAYILADILEGHAPAISSHGPMIST